MIVLEQMIVLWANVASGLPMLIWRVGRKGDGTEGEG